MKVMDVEVVVLRTAAVPLDSTLCRVSVGVGWVPVITLHLMVYGGSVAVVTAVSMNPLSPGKPTICAETGVEVNIQCQTDSSEHLHVHVPKI